MKKFLTSIGMLLLGSGVGLAQFTTVSATVVDSDSTTWASAPYSWSFQPGPYQSNPANYTYNGSPLASFSGSGAANGSGVISVSGAIYNVTLIRPIGASYNLIVCPNASTKCSTVNFAPSGSSISLTTQVNAAILAPRFQAVSGAYGYNDGEAVLQLQPGSTYWNVTSGVQRCYTGSAWGACSAGGTVPNPLTNGQQAVTQPNAGDQSADVATDLFVQKALNLSMAYTPFDNVTGGVYSFDSQGSGALVNYAVSGGAISSITTWIPFVGSGYLVGDIVTPQAGNFDAMIRVTAVSGSGAPTAGTILYGGTGYSAGTSVAASSAQALQFTFAFSGALTSNAYIIFQHGSYLTTSQQYIVSDNTTGNPTYSVILCVAGATDACAAGGRTVTLVEGTNDDTNTFVQTDGVENVDNAIGTLLPGAKAVTQALGDNTTAVATDAFVLANAGGGSGTVSDGAGTSTAGLTAQSTGTAHHITYVPPYAMNLCAPPSTAACDGITDDSSAIQTMLDSGLAAAYFIPFDSTGTEINTGTTGISINNEGVSFFGNGQYLKYSGSGNAVTINSSTPFYDNFTIVRDLIVDMTGSTGTPVAFYLPSQSSIQLFNNADFSGPSGYISIQATSSANQVTIENHDSPGLLSLGDGTSDAVITSTFANGCSQSGGTWTFVADTCGGTVGLTLATNSNNTFTNLAATHLNFGTSNQVVGTLLYSSGSVTITGTPAQGQLIFPDKTMNFGHTSFTGIVGGISKGPLCVDASGNLYVGNDAGGGALPCP